MKNKILILGLAASICLGSNALATTNCPTGTTLNTDCWSCGDDCTASLVDGVLSISGSGAMTDYNDNSNKAPWYSVRNSIESITFEGNTYNDDGSVKKQGISSIGSYAFQFASNLTSVDFPDSLTSIGSVAFRYSGLTSVTFPSNSAMTYIGDNSFLNATNLQSIVIPDSVTTIGDSAFWHADNLHTIVLGDNVTTIKSRALEHLPADLKIYCSNNTGRNLGGYQVPCSNVVPSNYLQLFTKDDDGVYSTVIDGVTYYYSSADKMVTGGVEAGCTSQESCAAVVAAALTAGSSNQGASGGTSGSQGAHSGKRIYTVEEARAAVEAAGTDTVNFRIRYK